MIAPTAVFVWVLRINATAQTLVGAIIDRQHLQQLYIFCLKTGLPQMKQPIFYSHPANFAHPCVGVF
jgi:hypothetical protein